MSRIKSTSDLEYLLTILNTSLQQYPLHSLQHVQIPSLVPSHVPFMDTYFKTCYTARQFLQHLTLYPSHMDSLQKLSDFPNLHHLTIYSKDCVVIEENKRVILAFLLASCPHLITLNIYHQIKRSDTSNKMIPCELLSLPLRHIDHHYRNLRNLSLSTTTLDTAQMEYILAFISTSHLTSLSINLENHRTLQEWIGEASIDTVLRFAHHLSLVSTLMFRIASKYDETDDRLTLNNVLQVNALLWSMANSIMTTAGTNTEKVYLKLDCMADLHRFSDETTTISMASLLNKQDFQFEIDRTDNGSLHLWQCAPFSIMMAHFFATETSPSTQHITHLDLKVPENQLIDGLTLILTYFTRLIEFTLTSPLTSQSIRGSKDEEATKFDALHIKHVALSTSWIHTLDRWLPFIETLWIEDCLFPEKNVLLDLSSMKHLHYCYFQFPELASRYPHVLVKLTTQKDNGRITYLTLVPQQEVERRVFVEIDSLQINQFLLSHPNVFTIEIVLSCLDIFKLDKWYEK
ncbi:hypothetical protein INT47_006890 [Mucor saturninus]|uniref:Uncharacterized protein n=1 Tax=Mucor saturninus TaxID=64648 RepID=A0A8H7RBF1_9FUNG|nr:hypothetical protein INT47_006890 [Mucor saturninus]